MFRLSIMYHYYRPESDAVTQKGGWFGNPGVRVKDSILPNIVPTDLPKNQHSGKSQVLHESFTSRSQVGLVQWPLGLHWTQHKKDTPGSWPCGCCRMEHDFHRATKDVRHNSIIYFDLQYDIYCTTTYYVSILVCFLISVSRSTSIQYCFGVDLQVFLCPIRRWLIPAIPSIGMLLLALAVVIGRCGVYHRELMTVMW